MSRVPSITVRGPCVDSINKSASRTTTTRCSVGAHETTQHSPFGYIKTVPLTSSPSFARSFYFTTSPPNRGQHILECISSHQAMVNDHRSVILTSSMAMYPRDPPHNAHARATHPPILYLLLCYENMASSCES